jgi:hypothetical protein
MMEKSKKPSNPVHKINVYALFVTLLPLNRVSSLRGAVKAIFILFYPFLKFV